MPANKSEDPSRLMVKTITSVRPIAFRVGWHTANRHSGEEPAPYSDTGTRSTLTVQRLDPVKRGWDSLQRGQMWQVWQKCGRFKSQNCHRPQSWPAPHLALAVAEVAEVAGLFKKLSADSPL